MKVLEIGPGTADGKSLFWPDADTVDIQADGATSNVDWGLEPLPFADDTYDLVFASHVLEHIPWYRTVSALREAHRVLKPGGEIEIYVPDFAFIVKCYTEQRCGDAWRVFNEASGWMTWVNGRIFTYGEDAKELLSKARPLVSSHHKAMFDQPYLIARLVDAGFHNIRPLSKRINGVAHSMVEAAALATKK